MSTTRPARREDYADFVRLFPELGVPDPIPAVDRWWEKQGPATLISEGDGEVRGYVWDELIGSTLYIRNVVTDPRFRRTGVAKRLIRASIDRARRVGAQSWCLNVKVSGAALLRGLAPHRVVFGTGDWRDVTVQLVIEDNEPLAAYFERHGAERMLRILHLAGPL